jgi:hypothetical protein
MDHRTIQNRLARLAVPLVVWLGSGCEGYPDIQEPGATVAPSPVAALEAQDQGTQQETSCYQPLWSGGGTKSERLCYVITWGYSSSGVYGKTGDVVIELVLHHAWPYSREAVVANPAGITVRDLWANGRGVRARVWWHIPGRPFNLDIPPTADNYVPGGFHKDTGASQQQQPLYVENRFFDGIALEYGDTWNNCHMCNRHYFFNIWDR